MKKPASATSKAKVTRVPKRPDQVRARVPGLWMLDAKSDAQRVDEAMNKLVLLLADPYGHEAFLQLVRRKHPLVVRRSGIAPAKGKLAAKLQWPALEVGKRPRGRPSKEDPHNVALINAFEQYERKRGRKINIAAFTRKQVREQCPTWSERQSERKAAQWAALLRDLRKKQRKQSEK